MLTFISGFGRYPTTQRRTFRPGRAQALIALPGAAFLALALLTPAAGVEGPISLSTPSVSPRSGSPTSRISFAVSYGNREGSAPGYVHVLIDGRAYAMHASGTLDYRTGVRYTYRASLPAGTHRISFDAADTRRFTATLAAGTVRVTSPAVVEPDRTGGSPAGGSPGGTTTDSTHEAPTGAGSTTANGGTGSSPVSGPRIGGSIDGDTDASGELVAAPVIRVIGDDILRDGHALPVREVSKPGAPLFPASAAGTERTGGSGAVSATALPATLRWPGAGSMTPEMRALAVALGTGGTAAVGMAFLIFGKRRRDGEQPAPDEVLEAAAARADATMSSTQLVPPVPGPQSLTPSELAMPRWRRPSLLEARKTDPTRTASTTYSLSFATGAVGLIDGLEKRRIRYRVVRLLDSPDELRGSELGVLDQGDEVQLVERNGPFWFVRCPDGREGWVHRMTLGDVVDEPKPTPTAGPAEPASERSGTPATAAPDHDVLSAFLRHEQARREAAPDTRAG